MHAKFVEGNHAHLYTINLVHLRMRHRDEWYQRAFETALRLAPQCKSLRSHSANTLQRVVLGNSLPREC